MLSSWARRADIEHDAAKSAVPLLCRVVEKCLQWFSSHKSDVKQILVQFEYVAQNLVLNSVRITPEEIVYEAVERSVTHIVKENAQTSLHEELSSMLGPPPPAVQTGEWATESLFMSSRLASCEPIIRACSFNDRSHLLLVGPDACAKNLLAEYIIKECNSTVIAIDCTPILEPADIINELKRLIEHGGFWSRGSDSEGGSSTHWCRVARLCVVACADSVAAMSPRLSAALAQYALNEPDDDEVLELVTSWLIQNADKNIQPNNIATLASTILGMYKEVSNFIDKFLIIKVTEIFDSRPQYKWNSSHLKRWCENVKWYSPSTMEELVTAIAAEANMIFRDRLVTDEERSRFNKISRSYLKIENDDLYFTCKLKGDGAYMESVDYGAWHQCTLKLINQCLSEYEHNVFGETGAEVCSELATLCPATARAVSLDIYNFIMKVINVLNE
ncbi:Cytoplasmic dynein heavy chain [Operophtera brumata]|uniref:Cytoplasmic dynein heavy chain n=1 Tax=Operophtera brumata TaxID=104452 RepID=A0A0L7LR68_OPEBR|nr:Cytoplasmic dynein heavy chain [Operophtera brumata]